MTLRALLLAALVAPIAGLAGCMDALGADTRVGGAGFDIGGADFYHSYWANAETHTDEFTWANPSGVAHVEARHDITTGYVHVTIRDANGAIVWTQDFARETRDGEFSPGTGAPGDWTITLERRAVTGRLDVHVWRGA